MFISFVEVSPGVFKPEEKNTPGNKEAHHCKWRGYLQSIKEVVKTVNS
jgi:hypothetical protein